MAAASEVQESSDGKNTSDETEMTSSSTVNNKIKLEDLKVADLKNELEKRDLDKNGVKSVLIERLKTAIAEEGEDPEEFKFIMSTDSTSNESPIKKLTVETLDTNGTIDTNDDVNNQEEKQDVALQLSLDEEEAQLNEESLIEITKQPDIENTKVIEIEETVEDLSASENVPEKQSTLPKVSKAQNEDHKEKKIVKTPVQNKSAANTVSASPKVLKVIGKSDKLKGPNVLAKSLWITGLPNTTRAADLKALFSKQGRVLSVKIVKSAKQTPGKCYGFLTMTSGKDATKAIQNLHRTELNGRIISVERKQNEPNTLLKKLDSKLLNFTATKKPAVKKEVATPKQVTNEKKPVIESKDASKIESKGDERKKSADVSLKKTDEKIGSTEKSKDKDRKPRERKDRERDGDRPVRRSASFRPRAFVNTDRPRFGNFRRPFGRRPFSSDYGTSFRPRSDTLQNMREERFQRERLRERREAERRREDELIRHRLIERKQREEAYRLEREKERLRIERELLERERSEILKLEREKAILERERLERERDELRRQAELGRSSKRPFSRVDRDPEPIWDERKKLPARYDVRPSLHGEASSSSRFAFPQRERTSFNREYERLPDKYSAPKHLEVIPRSDFADRDSRREITIRSRDERQIFNRSDFRDRDNRRSLPSREQERHTTSRREVTRNDWKHDRRVHERVTNNSSAPRRMNYY